MSFILAGLRRQEGACLITSDTPASIIDFASRYFHYDLMPHICKKELTLLSFSAGFEHKIKSLGSFDKPAEELKRIISSRDIQLLVINTVDPILMATDLSRPKPFIRGLVSGINECGATCLCTSIAGGAEILKIAVEELQSLTSCNISLTKENSHRMLHIADSAFLQNYRASIAIDLKGEKGIVAIAEPKMASLQAPLIASPSAEWTDSSFTRPFVSRLTSKLKKHD